MINFNLIVHEVFDEISVFIVVNLMHSLTYLTIWIRFWRSIAKLFIFFQRVTSRIRQRIFVYERTQGYTQSFSWCNWHVSSTTRWDWSACTLRFKIILEKNSTLISFPPCILFVSYFILRQISEFPKDQSYHGQITMFHAETLNEHKHWYPYLLPTIKIRNGLPFPESVTRILCRYSRRLLSMRTLKLPTLHRHSQIREDSTDSHTSLVPWILHPLDVIATYLTDTK